MGKDLSIMKNSPMPPNKESDDGSINNQILWVPHNDDAIRRRKKFLSKEVMHYLLIIEYL